MLTLEDAVREIERAVLHPETGLSDEVFRLVTKLTPMINVDLLIKNDAGETLLTWRDDPLCEPGWHIPGGIIRFEETIEHRIHAAALSELGTEVSFEPEPLKVTEFILPHQDCRNHFISLLYRCRLTGVLPEYLRCRDLNRPAPGQGAWFSGRPDRLLKVHEKYVSFI